MIASTSWIPLLAPVLLAVIVALKYPHVFWEQPCPSSSSPTSKEAPVAFPAGGGGEYWDALFRNISIDPCECFSQEYDQARSRFLHAAKQIEGAELYSLPIVSRSIVNDHKKKNEEEDESSSSYYTTDIVVLPGTPNAGLVVHSSGTHGVEGYAGSAIQIAFLLAWAKIFSTLPSQPNKDDAAPDERPTIILIHAVNPFGMARFRRFNENNVDLNRNGLEPHVFPEYAQHHYNRENYQRFSPAFNPPHAPTFWSTYVGYWQRILGLGAKHGLASLKGAMVAGQFHNPRGIFYGGARLEPSLHKLDEWLTDYLGSPQQRSRRKYPVVTWLDVHTGLGPFGKDILLTGALSTDTDDHRAYLRNELRTWYPEAHTSEDESGDSSLSSSSSQATTGGTSQGYENVVTIKRYFVKYFDAAQQKPLMMTQEFGTLPMVLVGRALVVENAAFQYLPPSQALTWAQRYLRPAFYPQHPRWRRMVLERGLQTLLQSIQRCSSVVSSSTTPDGSSWVAEE